VSRANVGGNFGYKGDEDPRRTPDEHRDAVVALFVPHSKILGL